MTILSTSLSTDHSMKRFVLAVKTIVERADFCNTFSNMKNVLNKN